MSIASVDLPDLEDEICLSLSKIINFRKHSLYFPDNPEILFLPEERRLFLPLDYKGSKLGSLILDNIDIKQIQLMLDNLPQIASICLELAITRQALKLDSQTGLANENTLMQYMEEIITPVLDNAFLHKLCMGMVVLSWGDVDQAIDDFGSGFCSDIFCEMATAVKQCLPEEGIASSLGWQEGRYEYGVLFPATGILACKRAAEKFLTNLERLNFEDSLSKRIYSPAFFAGIALYPQDMRGHELRLPMREQTMLLRDRARLAAKRSILTRGQRILPFEAIIQGYGKITQVLPGRKVRINLGDAMNVRLGMRFKVRGSIDDKIEEKGVIVIVEVYPFESLAEIISVSTPENPPDYEDQLLLIPSGLFAPANEIENDLKENLFFKWLPREDFFDSIINNREGHFTVGLCGFSNLREAERTENQLITRIEGWLNNLNGNLPQLFGIYDNYTYIFYHAGKGDSTGFYKYLTDQVQADGLNVSCGLFSYPYLSYGKNEAEECALKALEYARLLPAPHIGLFDSLALNISADKLASNGDYFGAIKEYEMSVMADKTNANAWNSLGVARAALGKDDEARRHFIKALRYSSDPELKAKVSYNLGVIFQKHKEYRAAASFFKRCVEIDEKHVYAWLRLGQIYEKRNKIADAKLAYTNALNAADENIEAANTAHRYLANLEESQNKIDEARNLLHDALLRDPADVLSLSALAKLYLKDDPQMSEMLARKSANSGYREAWEIVADALEAQGKYEDAELARKRFQ